MNSKKILCKLLVASLAVGTFTPGIVPNTLQVSAYNEVAIASVSESDFEFDAITGTVTKYVGVGGNVTIPSMIHNVTVRCIGADAFASNATITSVVIPQGVTTIEDEAFLNCPNLKSVVIPKGVVNLGKLAFFMCESLESITMGNGITVIDTNAFYGCKSLKNIQLPDSVTQIGDYAFMGCTSLEKMNIPVSTTGIRTGAFQDCTGLREICIPSTVTTIEGDAFDRDADMKINCEKGSIAYEYAYAYGFKNNVDGEAPEKVPTKAPASNQKKTYTISYVLNKGKISGSAIKTYDGTKNVSLPKVTRKNYLFKGWYAESSYKTKVTAIKKGTTGNKTMYAKWEKVKRPSRPSVSKVKNSKSKQMSITLKKKVSGAQGYEMLYATDKKFKKNKKTVRFTGTSKAVKKLKKGKTYYVKVRAYKLDSENERVYGDYSSVKKIKIKK